MSARHANRSNRNTNTNTNTNTSTNPASNSQIRPHRPPRPQNRGPDSSRIPSYSQLPPGTAVSITLKQDQGTGMEVQGYVQDLLTRGDHPRGVKVRLRDGRVGRVQRLWLEGMGGEEGEGVTGHGEGGESGRGEERERERMGSGIGAASWGGEGRLGDGVEGDDIEGGQELSLADYVVVDKRKGKAKSEKQGKVDQSKGMSECEDPEQGLERTAGLEELNSRLEEASISGTVTCPVCGEFEGDERAVEWHVNEHFS